MAMWEPGEFTVFIIHTFFVPQWEPGWSITRLLQVTQSVSLDMWKLYCQLSVYILVLRSERPLLINL